MSDIYSVIKLQERFVPADQINSLMSDKRIVQLRDLKFEIKSKIEQDRVVTGMVYKVSPTRTGKLGRGRLARTAQYADAWITDFHPYSPTYARLRITDTAAAIKLHRGDVWYLLNPELTADDDKGSVMAPVALTVDSKDKMLKVGMASGVGDCKAFLGAKNGQQCSFPVNSELDRSGLCHVHLEEQRSRSTSSRTMIGTRLCVNVPGARFSTEMKMADALLKPSEDSLKSRQEDEAAEKQGQARNLSLKLSRQRETSGQYARSNSGYINAVVKNFNPQQAATSIVPLLGRGLAEDSSIDFLINENDGGRLQNSQSVSTQNKKCEVPKSTMFRIPPVPTAPDESQDKEFSEQISNVKTQLNSAADEIDAVARLRDIIKILDSGLPAEVIRKSGIYTLVEGLASKSSSHDIVRPVAETVAKKLKARCEADLQSRKARKDIDAAAKISSSGFTLTDLMDRCVHGDRMMPKSSVEKGKRKRREPDNDQTQAPETKRRTATKTEKKPVSQPMSEDERNRLRELKSILKR
ncbi:minichromosome maintenance- protein [Perkinsus chesapeaki]|uniref:Minichromosome maintenance- protein n=1 Tax=Perkinsus chesapeaki TaxID=330153 RepID=A0A7J6MKW9_PERCH|nr:minichromosome maintenance- protein [Perkinsus chesapeaki]